MERDCGGGGEAGGGSGQSVVAWRSGEGVTAGVSGRGGAVLHGGLSGVQGQRGAGDDGTRGVGDDAADGRQGLGMRPKEQEGKQEQREQYAGKGLAWLGHRDRLAW